MSESKKDFRYRGERTTESRHDRSSLHPIALYLSDLTVWCRFTSGSYNPSGRGQTGPLWWRVRRSGSVVGSIFLIGVAAWKKTRFLWWWSARLQSHLRLFGLSRAPSFYPMALLIVNSLGLATNFGLCTRSVQERAPDYLPRTRSCRLVSCWFRSG